MTDDAPKEIKKKYRPPIRIHFYPAMANRSRYVRAKDKSMIIDALATDDSKQTTPT